MSLEDKFTTRRSTLKAGLAIIAGTGATAVAASRAKAQSAKADPSTVGYQTKPSSGQQCSGCVQWDPPNACKIVSGTISPSGWCELYSPKNA
jgi:hypothetical protein